MNSLAQAQQTVDAAKAVTVATRILERWGCNTQQQMTLLGIGSRTTLNKYQQGRMTGSPSGDLLERTSYILNIHAYLGLLMSRRESRDNWVNKANGYPLFNGKSALDHMLGGRVADLYEVARYLDGQRGGLAS